MNQWWLLLCVGLLIGDAALTHHIDEAIYEAQAEKLANGQQQITIAAEQGVVAEERKADSITQGVSHDYEIKVSAVDSEYQSLLERLHQPDTTTGNGLPSVPTGQPGHPAAACPAGFSERREKAFLKLMKQADEQTARLVACQNWVKSQGQ